MRTTIAATLCFPVLPGLLGDPALACTSFCMDTPDGPIFGTNLDLFIPGDGLVFVNRRGIAKQGYGTGTTGKTATWVSRYGSVTFNLAGRELAWSGMNEAGLVVSSMELMAGEYPEPDERPPVGNATWVQYVLDTCDSVEDVIRVDSLVRIEDQAPPNHYFVSDADGNCVAIEWLEGRFAYRAGDDLPIKAMSNMRCDRALAAHERGCPLGGEPGFQARPARRIRFLLRGAGFDARHQRAARGGCGRGLHALRSRR